MRPLQIFTISLLMAVFVCPAHSNVIVDGTDGSPDDIVEVRIRRTLAQDGRLFARLVVTMPSS